MNFWCNYTEIGAVRYHCKYIGDIRSSQL